MLAFPRRPPGRAGQQLPAVALAVALALLVVTSTTAAAAGDGVATGRGGDGGGSAEPCSALRLALPVGLADDGTLPAAWPAQEDVLQTCPSQCGAHVGIIGCDGRQQGSTTSTIGKPPYHHVGRFTGPGIGGCTGTLISDRHVLTAAHCVLDSDNDFRQGSILFRLGQYAANGSLPYGVSYGERVFVAKQYDNTSASQHNKALDWAVVELTAPISGAVPMGFGHVPWATLTQAVSRTVGYPGDKPTGTVWYHHGSFLDSGSVAWIDGGARGLLYVTNDGVGGQSGSPIYAFVGGTRKVVGVFIGSPASHCQAGRNWAARLTPGTTALIETAMQYPSLLDFANLRWSA